MSKKKGFEGHLPGHNILPPTKAERAEISKRIKNLVRQDDLTDEPVWEKISKEVRTGPLSILNEQLKDRIMAMVTQAMQDAFNRGKAIGYAEAKKKYQNKMNVRLR